MRYMDQTTDWTKKRKSEETQASCGTHPASHTMGAGVSYPWGKSGRGWRLSLTSFSYRGLECLKLYRYSPYMLSWRTKWQLYLRDVSFGSLWQIITIVSTGSYSKGVNGVTSSTTAQMLPYFVCSAYMIITPVILISYVLGHRMPEILVSIYTNAVIWIFHSLYPSGRTMALGSTQPQTEMSTGNISWGIKAAGAKGWQPYHLHVPTVLKSGSLDPMGLNRPLQEYIHLHIPTSKTDYLPKLDFWNRFLFQPFTGISAPNAPVV